MKFGVNSYHTSASTPGLIRCQLGNRYTPFQRAPNQIHQLYRPENIRYSKLAVPLSYFKEEVYRIISRSPLLRYVAVGARETFVSREHVPYDIWSVPRGLSSCHIIDINIVGEETSIRCQKTPGVVGLLELLISHYWRIMLIIRCAKSSIWCFFFYMHWSRALL